MRARLAVALLALSLAACGGGGRRARQVTTTTTATGTPSSVTSVATNPAGAGGYPSAIVHQVVDNPDFDVMEQRIVGLLRKADLPGASLLVVQHGKLVEQEGWLGYDLDTIVPIASASKWLSAATIMTLVDEGKVALDAPISTYLTDTAGTKVAAITLRQLLSFTSGLVDEDKIACSQDPAVTLQDCARQILRSGIVHPPGEAFRYGGQHLAVAGAIAEVVSGVPFADLFTQRIAKPLGMTRTAFLQVGTSEHLNVTHPMPAGSAAATLGDYGRFLEMISHDGVAPSGARLLSHEAIAEMQRNQIAGARYGSAAPFRVALKSPYGLGEWLDWTDQAGRATVVSSDGKFGFRPWIDKVNDLYGVYLVFDRGSGYVEGDPDAAADDGGKVHTSGPWIFELVADALGGSLPKTHYPR